MNTKQKLSIGIAAIFMVTLTIVGVTYAYFVTRVTGGTTPVEVTTATLGDVVYVPGNDGENGSDVLTMDNVIPGDDLDGDGEADKDVVYKKFAVLNENQDAATSGAYKVIITNKTIDGANEFIHTADGKNDDVMATCYGVVGGTLNTTLEGGYNYSQPLTLAEAKVAENAADEDSVLNTCFPQTAGDSIYNNIEITLYEVDAATYAAGEFADLSADDIVGTQTTLTYKSTDVITDKVTIFGTEANKDYYVLKVEYLNRDFNQNAENLAGLEIVVSIQAA